MANELKPCPFCGGSATVLKVDNVWFEVRCDDCPCNVGRSWFARRKEAIEAWNKRVPQTTVNQFGENCTHISNCGTLNLNL